MAPTAGNGGQDRARRTTWSFVTNHGNVLVCIARDPEVRLRDVATRVGITERAAQSIVADLVEAGYLQRQRVGRRNRYEVLDGSLRCPLEPDQPVGILVRALRLDGADTEHATGAAAS